MIDDIVELFIEIIKLPFRFVNWLIHLPFIKGKIGEKKVSKLINKLMCENDKLINNYMIENEMSSKSHQIDHILISSKGMFVIESKNFSGKIYGSDSRREWTQVLNYGKVKNKFYSPIKQNETHILAINELLKENNNKIHNIVIFVGADIDDINSSYVYTRKSFKKYYKKLEDGILSKETIDKIYETLINSKSKVRNIEHVKNIRTMKNKIDNNICPRCGNNLILRESKYGQFYGCSNYPKCKFKK